MKIRAFITHKQAEHFADCQDRFSVNPDTKSVAIADGMSQSYQQKIWAKLLVQTYTDNIEWIPNLASVRDLAPRWNEGVKQFIQALKDNNAPPYLVIMNENAIISRKSAGATFLGLRFEDYNWSGDVLGDSCLIEVKDKAIVNIYTSQNGDEFDNHPDYFDSNPFSEGKGKPLHISGVIDPSTILIMVSDPFSDFLNEKKKIGEERMFVDRLLNVSNHQEFEELVADWRDNHGMHNDDTTLLIIENDDSPDFHVTYCDEIDKMIDGEKGEEELIVNDEVNNVLQEETVVQNVSIQNDNDKQEDINFHHDDTNQRQEKMPLSEEEVEQMFLLEYRTACKDGRSRWYKKKTDDDYMIAIKQSVSAFYKHVTIYKN